MQKISTYVISVCMNLKLELASVETRVRAAGLTMKDFLAGAGVDNSTWVYWKNGSRAPQWQTWSRIEAALGKLKPRRAPKVNSRRA